MTFSGLKLGQNFLSPAAHPHQEVPGVPPLPPPPPPHLGFNLIGTTPFTSRYRLFFSILQSKFMSKAEKTGCSRRLVSIFT